MNIRRSRGVMSYQRDRAVLSASGAAIAPGANGPGAPVPAPVPAPVRLLDQVRARCRVKHYSLRTERAYLYWAKRFVMANDKQHPRTLGAEQIEAFLSRLATHHGVAASTQNQAISALLFLYREVLGGRLPWVASVV